MVDDFPISLEKAKEQRLELMEERKHLYAHHFFPADLPSLLFMASYEDLLRA